MISQADIRKVGDLPIEQVADALGLKVKRHWSLCPFHSDSRPSLYYRVNKNKFVCYVCQKYGGTIDLTMEMLHLSFRDAVCWLAQTFGIMIDEQYREFSNVRQRELIPVKEDIVNPVDTSMMAQLVAMPTLTDEAKSFLYDERKLNPRVIEWCGISSTHTHLLIPYFGADGVLQSVQWRYLGRHANPQLTDEPRFRFPRGSQSHMYNMQILKMLKTDEALFVTEGCSDCWAMLSAGHKAIAIPSATLLKAEDIKQLEGLNIHMFPDDDGPGERLFMQLSNADLRVTRHQLPAGCKDFAEYFVKMLIC